MSTVTDSSIVSREPPPASRRAPRAHVARLVIESFEEHAPLEPSEVRLPGPSRRWATVLILLVTAFVVGGIAASLWVYLPVTGHVGAEVFFSDLPPNLNQSSFQSSQEARLFDGEVRLAAIKMLATVDANLRPGFLASRQSQDLQCDWQWDSDRAILSIRYNSSTLLADRQRLSALLNSFERASQPQNMTVDTLKLQVKQADLDQKQSDLNYAQRRAVELEQEVAVLAAIAPTTPLVAENSSAASPPDAPSSLAATRRDLTDMQLRAQQLRVAVEQTRTELTELKSSIVEMNPHVTIEPARVLETRDLRLFAIGALALVVGFGLMLFNWSR